VLPEQRADVRAMTRAAKIAVQPRAVVPGDATVGALAGAPAPRRAVPFVAAVAPAAVREPGAGSPRRGGGRGAASAVRPASGAPRAQASGAPRSQASAAGRAQASGRPAGTRSPARAAAPVTTGPRRLAASGQTASSAPGRPVAAAAGQPSPRRHPRRSSAPAGTPATLTERSWRA
ncbi:MAG: hypothetical protein J0I40_11620, partial [Cellulomonas sp.]|nr:hypothetical protein [Cellulomonas sp.]